MTRVWQHFIRWSERNLDRQPQCDDPLAILGKLAALGLGLLLTPLWLLIGLLVLMSVALPLEVLFAALR